MPVDLKPHLYDPYMSQDPSTKSWDERFMDVMENYRHNGICAKIAESSNEDFKDAASSLDQVITVFVEWV